MKDTLNLTQNQSYEVSFAARNLFVQNNTGAWVYARIGTQQIPDSKSYDVAIPPYTQVSQPIDASRFFAFAIGTSFLPTATTSGAGISIQFDDEARNPIATNINTPGAAFQWYFVTLNPSIANTASVEVIPASAGKSIYVALIKVWPDPTIGGASTFEFYHTTSPDIITLMPATLTGASTARCIADEINAQPGGFPLPINKSLRVKNTTGSTRQPQIFVLYNYA